MAIEKHYFISYSRNDLNIARQIKTDLEKSGFQIWLDETAIIAGTRWNDAIRNNIRQSIAVLYLVSPSSRRSDNVAHELEYAKIDKKNIIPLWIQGDAPWAEMVVFGRSNTQYIDLRGDLHETGIEKLLQTLNNLSDSEPLFMTYLNEDDVESIINPSSTYTTPDIKERDMLEGTRENAPLQRNPYKGLRPFEYKDAVDFFGRKNLIDKMVQDVQSILSKAETDGQFPRCMMVVGASGSGKSSAVMAGLLPALEDKKNIPEVNRWFFLEPVRPGELPLDALAQAFKLPFLNVGSTPLRGWNEADLRQMLDEPDSSGLNRLLSKITDRPDERIVLIIDQFEELFAPTVDADQREQFINLLMATATEQSNLSTC